MTKAVYEYKAVAKGTLSSPYRFFKEGQIIKSHEPLEHPALVPLDEYVERKPKVLVPFMTINGVKQRPDHASVAPTLAQDQPKGKGVPTVASNAQYDRSMESVKRLEAALDSQVQTPKADPESDMKQGGEAGTGSQSVI